MMSGLMGLMGYRTFRYLKDTLGVTPAQQTLFDTWTIITWNFKPIVGLIEDTVYPFRYRTKSYVVISALWSIFFSLAIFVIGTPSLTQLTLLIALIYLAICFQDVMAEGLTAVVLVAEKRLAELKGEVHEANESKNIGNFMMIRFFVRTAVSLIGGAFGMHFSLGAVYLPIAFFQLLLMLYVIFAFHEERREKWINPGYGFKAKMKMFWGVMRKRDMLLPTILLTLTFSNPNFGEVLNYILTDKGWTGFELGYTYSIYGFSYFFLMMYLFNKVKSLSFTAGAFFSSLATVGADWIYYGYIYVNKWSFPEMATIHVMRAFLQGFSSDLISIPLVGRFSSKCPKGLENFGVTFLIALGNIGTTFSQLFASFLIHQYDITSKNYEDFIYPVRIVIIYSTLVLLLMPILGK